MLTVTNVWRKKRTHATQEEKTASLLMKMVTIEPLIFFCHLDSSPLASFFFLSFPFFLSIRA